MSKKSPPMFLNLLQMRFPVMAIVSIAHRVSGTVLALSLPWVIWVWSSIITLQHYKAMHHHLHTLTGRGLTTIVLLAMYFHLLAGIRHMIMDLGLFETKRGGRVSAWMVWIAFVMGALVIGGCIWQV